MEDSLMERKELRKSINSTPTMLQLGALATLMIIALSIFLAAAITAAVR